MDYRISEIYVVVDGPSQDYSETFIKILDSKLKDSGISNKSIVASLSEDKSLSVQTDPRQSKFSKIISESPTSFILVVALKRITTMNGSVTDSEIESLIYSKNSNKIIWKANIDCKGGGAIFDKSVFSHASENIIQQLRKDKLIN
jgi:hypothetical protein